MATQNLPILQSIVNLPFGGKTPFSAEVYFINTTVRMDITWGTSDPIQLIDPKYYVKLRIRAFGQMGIRINDAVTLFKDVIGGMQQSDLVKIDKIKEYYRGLLVLKVKTTIADTIITNKVSALDISAKLEEMSECVKVQIAPEFYKYGFDVCSFYIQSINFPDEDFEKINKILEDKAAFEIMGEGRYTTKRSFDIYEGAANNQNGMAGIFAAGGMGIGAAANIGMAMNQTVGNPIQKENTKNCINCGASIAVTSKFCPNCGANNSEIICDCGNTLPAGAKFCSQCGKQVQG